MISNVVGNYQIQSKIGEGGMGAVFRGLDLMLEREVAVKVLRPELASQPQVVERFRAEAVTLARLNHPHIATLYNFLRHNDDYLMVMEFVRGETLESVIHRCGALPLGQALRLFCQALEGIAHAHALGVVHRDLKPSNLMLTEAGATKVMDFGIARVLGSARMTRTGRILGTIEYMSPEQVHGQETDARSDIYSLGIVLYEMVTGRAPFNSQSEFELMRAQIEDPPPPPSNFAEHVPQAVEQIILRALAKDPAERFQTAAEFHAALTDAARTLDLSLTASAADVTAQRAGDERLAVDGLPETRLASAGDPFIKETRLGQIDGATPATPTASSFPASLRQMTQRFTWKHYGAAAAAVVALVVTFNLFDGRSGSSDGRNNSIPAPAPAASTVQVAPIVNPQPLIEPLDSGAGKPSVGVIVPNVTPQPARAPRTVKRNATYPPAPSAASVAAARPTPPPARQPEPPPAQGAEEQKKDKGPKWARIVGGAVEAINGTREVMKDLKSRDDKREKRKN